MSLVNARPPAGGAPASGCLQVWNPEIYTVNPAHQATLGWSLRAFRRAARRRRGAWRCRTLRHPAPLSWGGIRTHQPAGLKGRLPLHQSWVNQRKPMSPVGAGRAVPHAEPHGRGVACHGGGPARPGLAVLGLARRGGHQLGGGQPLCARCAAVARMSGSLAADAALLPS